MTLVLTVLLVGLAGGFVAWPLLRETGESEAREPGADAAMRRQALEHAKREAYAAIRDTEIDFHMGKLSDADFKAVRSKYENQALEVIAALDVGVAAGVAARPPISGSATAQHGAKFCPACGSKLPGKAKFCAACGAAIPAV